MVGEDGAVYEPVDADRQRSAVRFLIEEGFRTPDWLLDSNLLSLIEPAGTSDRIQRLQEGALNRVLDPVRLGRLAEAEWLKDDAYPAAEMMDDLQSGLFEETAGGRAIDPARRALQRAYVDRLGDILNGSPSSIPPQFVSVAYGYRPQDIDRSEARPPRPRRVARPRCRPRGRGRTLPWRRRAGRALPRARPSRPASITSSTPRTRRVWGKRGGA